MYYTRFQLSEFLGWPVDIRSIDSSVNRIPGTVITDSRNVFDRLETEVIQPGTGAEKRTTLELLALKGSQMRNGTRYRWVHSEAQLANGLTKEREYHQLSLFYQLNQRWRIVADDQRASARRRKAQGLGPLESRSSAALEHTDNTQLPPVSPSVSHTS